MTYCHYPWSNKIIKPRSKIHHAITLGTDGCIALASTIRAAQPAAFLLSLLLVLVRASPVWAELKIWDPVPPLGDSWDFGGHWDPSGEPTTNDDVFMLASLSFLKRTTLESNTALINNLDLVDGRLDLKGHTLFVSDTGNSGLATIRSSAELSIGSPNNDTKAADFHRLDLFGKIEMLGVTMVPN